MNALNRALWILIALGIGLLLAPRARGQFVDPAFSSFAQSSVGGSSTSSTTTTTTTQQSIAPQIIQQPAFVQPAIQSFAAPAPVYGGCGYGGNFARASFGYGGFGPSFASRGFYGRTGFGGFGNNVNVFVGNPGFVGRGAFVGNAGFVAPGFGANAFAGGGGGISRRANNNATAINGNGNVVINRNRRRLF